MDSAGQSRAATIDREREKLTLIRRSPSTCTLLALHLLPALAKRPRLSVVRTGGGYPFTRLSYRLKGGHERSLYLGNLGTQDERLLRDRIAARWPVMHYELCRTIRILRAHRREVRQRAHKLAAQCGYHFRGWALHRRLK